MDKSYKRSEDIDAKVQTIKLSYNAWRTLFLLDDETTVSQIVELLKEDKDVIENAILRLLEEGVITEAEEKKEAEQVEPEAEPVIADEPAIEEPAPLPETEVESREELAEASQVEEPAADVQPVIEELMETDEPAVAEEPEKAEPVAEEMMDVADQADEDIVIEEMPEEIQPTPEQEMIPEEDAKPDQPAPEEEIDIKIHDEQDAEAEMLDVDFAAPDLATEEEKPAKEETPAEAPAATEEPAPAPSGDQKTILVVDDSIVIRKMVEIALEEEDLHIETAVSGKDGLDKIDKVNPALIVLDLMLPDINGIDILKTVKASSKIPVIMLSGKDSPQMVENAKSAGADAFLPKPFKDDELKEQITKLLNG